ncbi:NtaA/DmoA family FMN-dependent monooxygenase [Muricoccus pecuniae]|uniref:FMN-dependent oxidoreductase (Nitrilotriacetate monooxygenase family) n=1 Tax=Muricoccus pecuniae TaxID=693023 RepID=A0A840Y2T0_9PROT|nr:NtaA/DmoA family FMN-dependent monooxygenase [Roseomonas pecuniae]MBB5695408.1 FMN-dependent oxidoreductase (nitrilotriacetate monooxygenase family) [Roseomonas pecuniae]
MSAYGTQQGAWRMPGVDPTAWTDIDQLVRFAQVAERGLLHFLFLPDFPALREDIERESVMMALDPLLTLTAIARETKRIGLVATGATTFAEPFTIARQFKALDIISHGRAGWNAVPMSDPTVAANFSHPLPPRQEKYERLHETVQIVQALWGSWGRDAWVHDQASGRFADAAKVQPVNLRGRHVASRGPLPIPPSEQGQPVIFQAGGGSAGLEVAGRYANGVAGAVWTIDDARAQRVALREAAARNGRDPDEVKFFAGVMPTIAPTRRAALDRRIALTEGKFEERVAYLQQMLGIRLDIGHLEQPLSPQQLAAARPSPHDPRSKNALKIAREGWSLRDVIAHGVIDYHPVIAGPGVAVADHMQEWFEAGAADGFWIMIDVYQDGMDAFADEVVPILQRRGLFHTEYESATLRDHLGAPAQYGLDPRLVG